MRTRPSPRPAAAKSEADISAEWDSVAEARFRQISDGLDPTYTDVLEPALLERAGELRGLRIVDAGCGAGFLTRKIARSAAAVVGVDPSAGQIALAERHHAAPNAEYRHATLEAFAATSRRQSDLVVAHMALMDVLDLDGFLRAARRLLTPAGRLVASLTHPWFWPRYWSYDDAPWFAYEREIVIEAPFAISLAPEPIGWTTHVHRPLARYASSLHAAGFDLERLDEPMPAADVAGRYPSEWDVPRYLVLSCRATTR